MRFDVKTIVSPDDFQTLDKKKKSLKGQYTAKKDKK